MRRTQACPPEELHEEMEIVPGEGKELSEEELKNHPLYQIIGMCSSGLGDGAENHDYYLYGENLS
ncbi:MAG: hypothetical protein WBW48_07945 [Anaerolineae bacterium]